MDEDFRVIFWNQRMESWTGRLRDGIEGVCLTELYPHLLDKKYQSRFAQLKVGGPPLIFSPQLHPHFIPTPLPDGRQRVQHTTVSLFFSDFDTRKKIFINIQDMTEPVRQLKEVLTLRKKLLEEKEELKIAKEKAEDATQLKDKFVTLVVHDLKSPFHTILGFLDLILHDTSEPLGAKHREMISRVVKIGNNLVQMIDELLKIGRFHTGKIALSKNFFDAFFIALSAIENYSHIAQKKGIVLENKIPPNTRIFGEMELIKEVIHNLVNNAIKFCNKGDCVTVFIHPDKTNVIGVRDTGLGIDANILPNIFKEDIKTTTIGTGGEKGTGLGLPLCHDIIKAHNGAITVESNKGLGITFYIELPSVRPLVLIVDDDKIVREMIIAFLRKRNMEFVEAENGKEALEILENKTVHLIISDISMPVMDGFQFLDNVKNNPNTNSIPFIILTADTQVETRNVAFQKGANDFVSKPLTVEEFIPRVRRYIF